jgi:hypothetical protein
LLVAAISAIGQPVNATATSTANAPKVWPHSLPFLGQAATERGYVLPRPFGLSLTYNSLQHELGLDNLQVDARAANQPPGEKQSVEAVAFDDVQDDNQSVMLRFDAWLLPFLNLFVMAGKIEGSTSLDLQLDLSEIGIQQTLSTSGEVDYAGETYSLGMNLAGGYKNLFGMLNITYSLSDVDIAPGTKITSLNVSPRIGLTTDAGSWGNVATYIGLTYLSYNMELEDSISIVNPLFRPIIGSNTLVIDYSIEAEEKRNWNGLIGANWDMSRSWSAQAELHGGGLRQQFIGSVTYRF